MSYLLLVYLYISIFVIRGDRGIISIKGIKGFRNYK